MSQPDRRDPPARGPDPARRAGPAAAPAAWSARRAPTVMASGKVGPGCLAGLGLAGVLLLIGLVFLSSYNGLVDKQENTKARWSNIDNQYKRRFDLIPNLVETVKGAANFEQGTLEAVTEARASVGRMQLPSTLPTDDAQLQAYMNAQQGLGSALSRLLVVAEAYPQLTATAGFRDLQAQLEGTENRITVARTDYIDAARDYNAALRKFPGAVVASFGDFERAAEFTVAEGERETPKVDFGGLGGGK